MGMVADWSGITGVIGGFLTSFLGGKWITSGGHPMVAIGPILFLGPLVTLSVHTIHKLMSKV